MKQGRRPTVKQMNIMLKNKMNPKDWFVCKVLIDRLECVNRWDESRKTAFCEVMG